MILVNSIMILLNSLGALWKFFGNSLGILWNSLEFFGILWNSLEFFGILWNSLEFFGILWNSLEILWGSLRMYGWGVLSVWVLILGNLTSSEDLKGKTRTKTITRSAELERA
jgi:hypothetical protein